MTLRGRLVALAVVVVLLFTLGIVVLVRSRTAGCNIAAPRPSLSSALRALGDFDHSFDATDSATIEDAATEAAGATNADLIGVSAGTPVTVAAAGGGLPDALVVPLRSPVTTPGTASLAGLVVFLRDCQGNAYFGAVEDDSSAQPRLTRFPPVSRQSAAAQLGTPGLALEYTTSPLRPVWVTVTSPERSLAAR